MGIFKSMAGMVKVELTSADIPRSLRAMTDQGIRMYSVQTDGELTAMFEIDRRDYRKLSGLAKRRGELLRIIAKNGLYWDFKGLLKRPVMLLCFVAILFLASVLPSRVLFVQVEGNKVVPTRLIVEAAGESGICFGASRRKVRSEKVKNALLSAVPQLQWAGVNTYGCTAVISVRERAKEEKEPTPSGISSIVAARDGIILSCTVTRGTGQCSVGQAVQAGQLLISGYTDCGLCITATRAEGEIVAETNRDLTVKMPSRVLIRTAFGRQSTKYSLLVGKKRINFYKGSGISDATCVKMYSEYALTLPGGFQLPVALVKETFLSCDFTAAEWSEEQARTFLADFASEYLRQQMIAGCVTDRCEEVTQEEGIWHLTGEYACVEMIGRQQDENGVVP